MKTASRVLWSEGLFLRPQHLQCQDRYQDERLWTTAGMLRAFPWGIACATVAGVDSELDVLSIIRIDAILPGGDHVRAPHPDMLPSPLSLRDFPESVDVLTVCVTLPPLRQSGENCTAEIKPAQRYVMREEQTADVFGCASVSPVHFASYCPRLIVEEEQGADFMALPILRMRRGKDGKFNIDETFVAPALTVAASPPLFERLCRLLEVLHAKAASLMDDHAEPIRDAVAFRAGDHASFWLLHTVSSAAASLGHIRAVPRVAPETLHRELLRLAGGLMAFSRSHRVSSLPPYRHERSDDGFKALFGIVDDLVDTVIPTRFVPITLERQGSSYFVGRINAEKVDAEATLYLGVSPGSVGQDLPATVPVRFKIGAPDDVEKAVTSALPCIMTTHVPQPPASIPVKPGYTYFMLDSRGASYERMLLGGSVRIFTPSGTDELKLELFAVVA